MPQPLSSTDFAIRVLASLALLTSPMTMVWYWSTSLRLNLCSASLRRLAMARWMRFACRFWPRRCAIASLPVAVARDRHVLEAKVHANGFLRRDVLLGLDCHRQAQPPVADGILREATLLPGHPIKAV
ncbi:MAG TPA: hypothetical protein PKC22_17450 [Rhodocyclaceae bacterium]|nr:hypothetical protein [Rhodocyclaceae bacterium]